MRIIRVKNTLNVIEEIKAEITNWLDNEGNQYSTARDSRRRDYVIIDRDFYGPIWKRESNAWMYRGIKA